MMVNEQSYILELFFLILASVILTPYTYLTNNVNQYIYISIK